MGRSRVRNGSAVPVALLAIVVAVIWTMLLRLAIAFWRTDLSWRYVAEQSRLGAPWYYRVAGVWGAMPGSLLLFAGIVGIVALASLRSFDRLDRLPAWFAVATVAALTTIDLALASPFERLSIPAVQGFGLTPILEHPAMAVHPPVLYLGLACALPPLLIGMRSDAGTVHLNARVRRWLLGVVGLLAAAMTLGAAWSYMEQGWGGYWAWDPVENTSLLVWLAALGALHALPLGGRLAGVTSGIPWPLALVGATLVRSGIAASIHGFAEAASVGWSLLALTVTSIAVVTVMRVRAVSVTAPAREADDPPTSGQRRVSVVIVSVTAGWVLLGTVAPVLADVVGGRRSAVRGEFYSSLVGPLGLLAVPFIALRLRRWHGTATVAHLGALILLVGIGASTFDTSDDATLTAGETRRIAGLEVTNTRVDVLDGSRRDTTAVVVRLRVDDRAMSASLVVYPDRGGRLAEVAIESGPWRDIQVALVDAADNGTAVITVRTRPLVWLLWIGATIVAISTIAGAFTGRRRPTAGAGAGRAAR